MSATIQAAVAELNARLGGGLDEGTAKFAIPGEGTILLDSAGAREGDGPADVTLTAATETFRAILDGTRDPMAAFLAGDLRVDGDMAFAFRLAGALRAA